MTRFALASVVGSMRQLLAVMVAVLAVSGTAYLVSHKLSNPDHYSAVGRGLCNRPSYGELMGGPPPCSPPTRAAWQIPIAIVIAAVGLGAAVKVAGERRPWRHVRDG